MKSEDPREDPEDPTKVKEDPTKKKDPTKVKKTRPRLDLAKTSPKPVPVVANHRSPAGGQPHAGLAVVPSCAAIACSDHSS